MTNTAPDVLAPWALAAFERYAGAATAGAKKGEPLGILELYGYGVGVAPAVGR